MKALVTGGTGFVGNHLIRALRARNWSVRVLALTGEDTARLEQENVTVHRGSICELATLIEAMNGIDVVFHLAGIHGLWCAKEEYFRVNVDGTENVCKAVLASGVSRLVHVSTWAVYEMGLGRPLREESPICPSPDTYTLTKAEGDKLVQRYIREHNLPAVIVRPGVMFGPGDRVNFGRMAERLRAGKTVLIGSGKNAQTFVFVTDVAEGMVLAATAERVVGQIYNLGPDQPLSQEQFWRAIAEDIGVRPPWLRVPYWALYAAAWLAERATGKDLRRQPLVTRLGVKLFGSHNLICIEKARRELGYSPRVPVREGIRLTAEWYLKQSSSAAQSAQVCTATTQSAA